MTPPLIVPVEPTPSAHDPTPRRRRPRVDPVKLFPNGGPSN